MGDKKTKIVPFDLERPFHPVTPHLPKILRGIRKESGMTAKEVARHLGVSQPYVSGNENGHAQPSIKYVLNFARLFKKSEKQLLLAAGLLHPQYQTLAALKPNEVYERMESLLEDISEDHEIPLYPDGMDYTRR